MSRAFVRVCHLETDALNWWVLLSDAYSHTPFRQKHWIVWLCWVMCMATPTLRQSWIDWPIAELIGSLKWCIWPRPLLGKSSEFICSGMWCVTTPTSSQKHSIDWLWWLSYMATPTWRIKSTGQTDICTVRRNFFSNVWNEKNLSLTNVQTKPRLY